MADKLRTTSNLLHLQSKYIGTGHADVTKYEWSNNIHRDTLASYVGHPSLLEYISVGMGESREVTRARMVEQMIRPVGPPAKEDEDNA